MGNVQTSQTSTQNNSAAVRDTIDKLATGVGNAYTAGPQIFNKSLYVAPGQTTTDSWTNALSAANNPGYTNSVNGALSSLGGVARGDYLNNSNPYFEANLQKTLNDTSSGINAGLGASGRLGSNLQVQSLSEGLGNVSNAARSQQYETERDRQVQAAGMLPGLYQAGLQPSTVQAQIGAAQDANASAARQGEYDLFSRQANGQTDLLAKLSAILAGNADAAGSNTSKSVPWWSALLGGAATVAGLSGDDDN